MAVAIARRLADGPFVDTQRARLAPLRQTANLIHNGSAELGLSVLKSRRTIIKEGSPNVTPKSSQISRAVARGESIAGIADRFGISDGEAWSQLSRGVAELNRRGSTALDAVRWHQYLVLMRIVDQALAAFDMSADKGVSEVTIQTIQSQNNSGEQGLTRKSVTQHVRKDAGDPRLLEVVMTALREIRDLFKIGAQGSEHQIPLTR